MAAQSNTRWKEALDELEAWCSSKGLKLFFQRSERTGAYWDMSREIIVNSRFCDETKCYIILHEAGHYLYSIDHSGGRPTQRVKAIEPQSDSPVHHRHEHALNLLKEEYEAWDRGLKLGRRLGILPTGDPPKNWNKIKNKCLASYVADTAAKLAEKS